MNPDEVNAMWQRAIRAKAALAEEMFSEGKKPTPEDIIAVALAHPYKFDILVREKG